MNLTEEHSEIIGLRIYVSERDLVEATGLPMIGNQWFCQKRQNLTTVEDAVGEQVQPRSRGIALETLPRPWD